MRTEVRIAATTPAAAERARQLGYRVEWMGAGNGFAVERPGGAAWTDDGVDWFLRMASVAHAMRAGGFADGRGGGGTFAVCHARRGRPTTRHDHDVPPMT